MKSGKIHKTPEPHSIFDRTASVYALVLICIVCWYPALLNGFTNWDDHVYLTDNPLIKKFSIESVQAVFSSYLMGNYHPLVPFSYMLEYSLVGLKPFLYHFDNLVLHILNTLLVLQILKRLTGSAAGAFTGAILFGLHPLHVESVAWVTERKDVLYTLFFLLATIQWLDFRATQAKSKYFLANLFFVLSCLSKGMAVVWPVWIVLIHLLPDTNNKLNTGGLTEIKKYIPAFILPFILAAGFGYLAVVAQSSEGAVRPDNPFLFPDNFIVASWGILFYIQKTLVPLGLSAFYPYPVPARTFPAYWYSGLILVPVITAWVLYLWKKGNVYPAFAWLSYVAILLPVSQILPVGSAFAADRYFYLASLGICFLLAWSWTLLEKKVTLNQQYGILLVLILLWGGLTWQRTFIWKNTESLFLDVIKTYPQVPVAYNNIGNEYETRKEYQTAKAWYLKSVQAKSDYSEGLMNMGVVYERLLQYDSAVYYYQTLLNYYPQHPTIKNVLANANNKYGNRMRELGNTEAAANLFLTSLKWDQNYAEAWNNLGSLYYTQSKPDSGILLIRQALSIRPEYAEAWSNLGSIYGATGKTDSAVICFTKAVDLNPEYAPAWFNLGYALKLTGNQAEALKAFQKSAALGHGPARQLLNSGV